MIATNGFMEPAETIITALGGPSAVARAAGVHRTRVSMWKAPRERGGTNGLIPYRHVPRLLEFAKERGVELEPGDFIPPADDAA
ncbi:carph-isopro domain-containing protein [Phaeobacter sp. JH203A]|uniref:carph-isopro domain-containing protein n=1 Tax=Phaeobacter sp. JH203A TaxID=3112501 RepID=UPI003A86D99A